MLLLIYDEFMNCVMINVLFWLSCCVFGDFYKNGSKLEKFDFDEFKWINGVVMLSWID